MTTPTKPCENCGGENTTDGLACETCTTFAVRVGVEALRQFNDEPQPGERGVEALKLSDRRRRYQRIMIDTAKRRDKK